MDRNNHLPRGPTFVGPPLPSVDPLPPSSRSDEVLRVVHQASREARPDETVQLAELFGRGRDWAQILTSFCKCNELRVPEASYFIRCHDIWSRKPLAYFDIKLIGPPEDAPTGSTRRVIRYIIRVFGERYTGPVWNVSGTAIENVPEYVQVFYPAQDLRKPFMPDQDSLNRALTRRFNRLLHIRGTARGKVQEPLHE